MGGFLGSMAGSMQNLGGGFEGNGLLQAILRRRGTPSPAPEMAGPMSSLIGVNSMSGDPNTPVPPNAPAPPITMGPGAAVGGDPNTMGGGSGILEMLRSKIGGLGKGTSGGYTGGNMAPSPLGGSAMRRPAKGPVNRQRMMPRRAINPNQPVRPPTNMSMY